MTDDSVPEPSTATVVHLPPNVSKYFIAPEDCLCIVLDGVATREECNYIISRGCPGLRSVSSIRARYASPESENKTEYHLAVIEDKGFADMLWARIRGRAATAIERFVAREPGCQGPVGLTHRLRLLRYEGTDRFDPHYDRIVPDERGENESLITVLLYLNDGEGVEFDGGDTLFLNAKHVNRGAAHVVPKAGRMVLFEHGLFHAGAPLGSNIAGSKYVMRTDVMFPMRPAWSR